MANHLSLSFLYRSPFCYCSRVAQLRLSGGVPRMLNLLEQAISTDNSEFAAKIIQDALGIESDDDVNY